MSVIADVTFNLKITFPNVNSSWGDTTGILQIQSQAETAAKTKLIKLLEKGEAESKIKYDIGITEVIVHISKIN